MANPLKQLAGQTVIYGMSTILARIINFLFVPLYTYILSTTDYGILTEFMAYIALLQVALLLGLETGCFRFANREGNDPNTVFSNAYLAVSAVSLVALLLLGSFSETLSVRMGYGDSQICYWLIGLILAMDSTTAILFAKLRFEIVFAYNFRVHFQIPSSSQHLATMLSISAIFFSLNKKKI